MSEQEQKPGMWQVLRRETVYTSRWVNLHLDWVRLPDGTIIEGHHVLEFPRPAVGVIATNAAGQLMLVLHHRFISGEYGWEIPTGGVEVGEEWETAARRELFEESGCSGGEISYLGHCFPCNGISDAHYGYYFVRGVEQTTVIQDTNEIIEARWFSVAEVRAMLDKNEITDGFTVTGLLWAFYKGLI